MTPGLVPRRQTSGRAALWDDGVQRRRNGEVHTTAERDWKGPGTRRQGEPSTKSIYYLSIQEMDG
jgi:hypothetical protein